MLFKLILVGLLTVAVVTAVPTATAENPCNGEVDVTCEHNSNACVLYANHSAPDVDKCIIGG
jgi:hypothetical protein